MPNKCNPSQVIKYIGRYLGRPVIMLFLELYFKHKPVSLQELYEKAMRKHRCRSPALHSALPQPRYS